EAVQHQEERGRLGRREHAAELVLEQQAENAGRNRPDHEQPAQLRVRVLLRDLAVSKAAAEPLHDPHPVAPKEAEQHESRGEVRADQEDDEEVAVRLDVPAEQVGDDHAVAEARDREQLGEALEQSEDDRLPVRDQAVVFFFFGALWNQAKARQARPRMNAAMPCFVWWWFEPLSWPGKKPGSDLAGSAQ